MKKIRHINSFDMLNTFRNISISVWFQGCPHHCKGCFNPETWKETNEVLDASTFAEIEEAMIKDGITKDISYLGGDPFAESNRDAFITLLKHVNQSFPNSKQFAWTGYEFDEIKHLPHLEYLDVIVDGKFVQELKIDGKKYGSSNQKVWIKDGLTWKVSNEY